MVMEWQLAHGKTLTLANKSHIMGILNVTPDSFSDGGQFSDTISALNHADMLKSQGASLIDIGGESTRPGAQLLDSATETARILPVVEHLAQKDDMILSIDTYHAETAEACLEAGAHIINDIYGLQREPQMAEVIAAHQAGVVIMHTGRERDKCDDVIEDQKRFFEHSLQIADKAGIKPANIVLDPGFGFAKNVEENLQLIQQFEELHQFGFPLLIGVSRKRFVATLSGQADVAQRDQASAALSVILRAKGALIFRVHNVAANCDPLRIADAVYGNYYDEA